MYQKTEVLGMYSFEFEGKNVNKAIKKASEELNLAMDEINYKIVTRGSTGIFGLTSAKKAKILVQLPDGINEKDAVTEPKADDPGNENFEIERIKKETSFEYKDPGSGLLNSIDGDPLELGREVLQRIVDSVTVDAEIAVERKADRILLKVAGGNPALLIGKKGQTLEAIQSIVEKIINKHSNTEHRIRVQVDVEGYLENRKINLERLAIRLAEKSKRIRKPISLGQMRAYDRRIVHMALKDDPDVHTKSRGDANIKKLVIFPNKTKTRRQRSN
jgi:spoIIIJ-associated protein